MGTTDRERVNFDDAYADVMRDMSRGTGWDEGGIFGSTAVEAALIEEREGSHPYEGARSEIIAERVKVRRRERMLVVERLVDELPDTVDWIKGAVADRAREARTALLRPGKRLVDRCKWVAAEILARAVIIRDGGRDGGAYTGRYPRDEIYR